TKIPIELVCLVYPERSVDDLIKAARVPDVRKYAKPMPFLLLRRTDFITGLSAIHLERRGGRGSQRDRDRDGSRNDEGRGVRQPLDPTGCGPALNQRPLGYELPRGMSVTL